ncbi:juvenile hormone acid O-methyltransferase-like isoform X1 [Neodiprion lecontei]|uniref:Juvenile hormone acid O-methyltransferase-like isoform X1 n=2 Tax=Neodiprion lecontei TaxID=441921 RepID=A0ABM3FSL9_NEOLC|nr:juvenile hormone acid O-methyltransferase-like isoform X1 [Neodiprion lecontei]XP_046591025.1 juvenile hormone acid O-methyltransferase-like isoform X1 [Neodiprion lecontei]
MFKPALYSKINNEARRDTSDFIEEYSNEIGQMSGRCLDIGSGPCDVVTDFLLPKLNPKSTVVCSDISKPMLDYAKEKYGANDRLSFLQLDIESPTLAEDLVEQFDHVTSFYCLHWCEDMRQAFENIFELLRPGGSGFLTFVSDFPCMDAYKVLAAMPRYQRYMTDADRFIPVFQHAEHPRENLKKLLREVGFEISHCSRREISNIYDTPNDFGRVMAAVNPFIHRMPAQLQREYEVDLGIEATKNAIVFNKDNSGGYNVLCRHHMFLVYLKKPSIN